MQTFMPYSSFCKVATVLDDKRLGKQRVEAMQILKAIHDPTYGWQHHPAIRMWRGASFFLVRYGIAMCREWANRGFEENMEEQFRVFHVPFPSEFHFPKWINNKWLQLSHRSNLIRKDKQHYGPIWPHARSFFPYVWPESPASGAGNRELVSPIPRLDSVSQPKPKRLQICNNGKAQFSWKGNTLVCIGAKGNASGNSRLDTNTFTGQERALAH